MGNNVVLKHKDTGLIKEAKAGFSWTNLFFSVFTPLFRGDFKWFVLQLAANVITMGFTVLVFPFFYNKWYIKDLIEKGYYPVDDRSKALLQKRNII